MQRKDMFVIISACSSHQDVRHMSVVKRFLMYRLIAQVAIPVFTHLFPVELSSFEVVGVTHLEHVLQVAVKMHVHLHTVYVLNCQVVAVSRWVHYRASYLLPYQTLSGSNMGLLISPIDAIRINLGISSFETTIFLSHSIIVSQCLQVRFSATLVRYGDTASTAMACSWDTQAWELAAGFLLGCLVEVLHLRLALGRLSTCALEVLLARWMGEDGLWDL